jgi:hypothetical protein
MDHKEAVQLQAAAKYVLGELPQAERDSFEEHYFDCGECALDVRAAAAFVETGREILRAETAGTAVARPAESKGGWLFWLRPAFAAPALLILLAIIGYQNGITIPQARKEAGLNAGQFFSSSFSLQMANTRGGEEVKVRVHPNESFALKFDFTPAKALNSYLCELRDESGRSVLQAVVPGSSTNQEAQFVVPAGRVRPGKYSLVFTGGPGTSSQDRKAEVLRLGFSVEFPY